MDDRVDRELERLQRRGVDLNRLNVPQEERDRQRAEGISRVRKLSITMLVISVIGIGCGVVSWAASAPEHHFPYNIPGAAIAGGFALLAAIVGLSAERRSRRHPHGDVVGSCFTRLIVCFLVFNCISITACFVMLFMPGVTSLAYCYGDERDEDIFLDPNYGICQGPSRQAILSMTVVTITMCVLLGICNLVGICLHQSFSRAFGIKSRAERLLDYQAQRMLAVQRRMEEHSRATQPEVVSLVTPGSHVTMPGAPITFAGQTYVPAGAAQALPLDTPGTCNTIQGVGDRAAQAGAPIIYAGRLYVPASTCAASAPPLETLRYGFHGVDSLQRPEPPLHDDDGPPPSYEEVQRMELMQGKGN